MGHGNAHPTWQTVNGTIAALENDLVLSIKLKIYSPIDRYPSSTKETSAYVYQDIHSRKFIKAMNWKQPKWPSSVECMNKQKCSHTIQSSTLQRK